ncbi:MAG: hypothetical protein AABW51_05245 [Nanoarchaeota archaeon]
MPKKRARKNLKVVAQKKGVKHHIKLATFFASKLIIALISFAIGIYIGKLFQTTWVAIVIASVIAIFIYLLSVIHAMKLFKI